MIVDSLENEIKIGDIVLYPVGDGGAEHGVVVKFNMKTKSEYDHNTKSYIDVEVPSLRVRKFNIKTNGYWINDDGSSGYKGNKSKYIANEPEYVAKDVAIQRVNMTTVITSLALPEKFKRLRELSNSLLYGD